jgi:hypothetical protein
MKKQERRDRRKTKGHLLQESRLVFVLHVRSKLNLGLKSTKLAGFLEGDRMGAIQDVIPSLKHTRKEKHQGPGECDASPY